MLIFDGFKTRKDAEDFTRHVATTFSRSGNVYDSQDESDRIDPSPYKLRPPIVLIERFVVAQCNDGVDMADELKVMAAVEQFGGHFAGT